MGALAAKIYKNEIDVFKHIKLKNSHIKNSIVKSKKYNYIYNKKYIPSLKKIKELNNIIEIKY